MKTQINKLTTLFWNYGEKTFQPRIKAEIGLNGSSFANLKCDIKVAASALLKV